MVSIKKQINYLKNVSYSININFHCLKIIERKYRNEGVDEIWENVFWVLFDHHKHKKSILGTLTK